MHMDQKIFTLGLSTETVSCYLILTGLADQDLPLLKSEVEKLWTGDPEALAKALMELNHRGIIDLPGAAETPLRLLPAEVWGN